MSKLKYFANIKKVVFLCVFMSYLQASDSAVDSDRIQLGVSNKFKNILNGQPD